MNIDAWVSKEPLPAPATASPMMDMQTFSGVADNDVSKVWGNIEVNGKVVAQIYKNGIVASDSKYQLPDWSLEGPEARAASILKAYGGKLVLRKDIKNLVQFLG